MAGWFEKHWKALAAGTAVGVVGVYLYEKKAAASTTAAALPASSTVNLQPGATAIAVSKGGSVCSRPPERRDVGLVQPHLPDDRRQPCAERQHLRHDDGHELGGHHGQLGRLGRTRAEHDHQRQRGLMGVVGHAVQEQGPAAVDVREQA